MATLKDLGLDEAQRKACLFPGQALVVAGPGAGKTRTLLGRALYLLEEGIPEEEVVLLTFTVKTASELRERLNSLGLSGVRVETFHGLAYELLRREGLRPRLATPEEQEAIFKDILRKKGYPVRGALKRLERALATGEEKDLVEAYEKRLSAEGLFDFRGLIREASRRNPYAQARLHLLVDEFQDLNPELCQFLGSFKGATFFLVGDPAQAIYSFRGARPEVVKEFLAGLRLKIFHLAKSYRVPQNILSFAEGLRDRTFEAPPLEAQREGGRLALVSFKGPAEEARGVSRRVEALLGGVQLESSRLGLSPGEVAVLSRVRRLLEPVKEALSLAGIPFEERDEGEAEALKALSEVKSLAEAKEMASNIPELSFLLEKCQGLDDLRFYLSLYALTASIRLKRKGVALLTVHETKGLEFKAVFLVGAEEGLMPFELMPDADPEEERRLAYVAVTRASEVFTASFTRQRTIFGKRLPGRPSPFFSSLPQEKASSSRPRRPRQKAFL